ncbi:MmgE/PrpD family protein [Georgenia sp. MJ206]|uniref:MmgE/PrpD family protein n=1 Tax=Georgenia wangjunii TaxID=3117730 RepID=UPI002F26248F
MRSPSADWRALTATVLGARPLDDPRVAPAAQAAVEDFLASSLMARHDPAVTRLLDHARAQGVPARPRTVVGHGDGASAALAALVGGFQAHLLDVDDTHAHVRGHPSAVLLPALLAVAEDGTDGRRLLAAYAVGVEVMARLGRLLGPAHYEAGWHTTGTAGPLAGAFACSHLLGLDVEQTATAVSLAASQAGGIRAQFGTQAKPLQAGLASQSAVQATGLARAGVEANPDFLEPSTGFLAAHGVGDDLAELTDGWGTSWRVVDPGLWMKRYPFCSAAMSASDAAAEVAAALARQVTDSGAPAPDGPAGGTPANGAPTAIDRGAGIERVAVRVRHGADTALRHTRPRTGEEGRFSAEYVVALHLAGHEPTLEHFTPAPPAPEVARLVERTTREHVPEDAALRAGERSFWAEVVVTLAGGREVRAAVEHPLGSPRNPLGGGARRAKLVDATGSEVAAAAVRAAVAALPTGTVGSLVGTVRDAVAPG